MLNIFLLFGFVLLFLLPLNVNTQLINSSFSSDGSNNEILLVCQTHKFCRTNPLIINTIPHIILSRYNIAFSRHAKIKSPTTTEISINLPHPFLHTFIYRKQLMSINLTPIDHLNHSPTSKTKRCLIVPDGIFTSRFSSSVMDDYISRIESILLDHYEWYQDPVQRIVHTKNRHIMLIKVLVERHNLSISNCGRSQFPKNRDQWDIDLAVYTYPQKFHHLGTTNVDLIHSGEQVKVQFAAVRRYDIYTLFVGLVSPMGWKVFAASVLLLVFLTLCIVGYHHHLTDYIIPPAVSASRVAEFLMRANIEQCVINAQTTVILGNKIDLKLIYATYLLYCIVISTAFKSNLVQELMKPSATLSSRTFQELVVDSRSIYSLDERKGGQSMSAYTSLESEVARYPEKSVYQKLLKKYNRRTAPDIDHVLSGKVNIMDEGELLKIMFEILEQKYGLRGYKIGTESIVNDVFWAVKHSEVSTGIRETLRIIISSGIGNHFRLVGVIVKQNCS